MKPDILVISSLRPDQMELLEATYKLHRYDLHSDPDSFLKEVGSRIRGVVTTGSEGFKQEIADQLPNLEVVSSSSVGYDNICVEACRARNIPVTNTPDVLTDDVADLALGLVICARRNMVNADAYVRTGAWGEQGMFGLTRALRGKKMGIIGLGRIGYAIALRGAPFGLEIGYTSRTERGDVDYRYFGDARNLAAWADIIVVATPGGKATQGLVSKDIIEALGPEGTLINISRGSVVDESALIEALEDGRLGSAGLDVFRDEPNLDPALAKFPNLVLQPHHGSGTVETRDAMSQLVVDNIAAHFAGEPLLTPIH